MMKWKLKVPKQQGGSGWKIKGCLKLSPEVVGYSHWCPVLGAYNIEWGDIYWSWG